MQIVFGFSNLSHWARSMAAAAAWGLKTLEQKEPAILVGMVARSWTPAWSASTTMATTSSGRPLQWIEEFVLWILGQCWNWKVNSPYHPPYCLPCFLFIMEPMIHNPGHTSPEDSVAMRHCLAGCSWPWNMLLFRLQRDLPMTPARRWSNKIGGIKLIQHLFHNQIWIRDSTGWPKKNTYEKSSCNCPHCDAQLHRSRKTSFEKVMLTLYMGPPFAAVEIPTLSTHNDVLSLDRHSWKFMFESIVVISLSSILFLQWRLFNVIYESSKSHHIKILN